VMTSLNLITKNKKAWLLPRFFIFS